MNLPLFTLFTLPEHRQLWRALRAAGPADAWGLMNGLAELDGPLYEAKNEPEQRAEFFARRAREFMTLAPAISADEADEAARRYGTYGPRLQLEASYLTLWFSDPHTLFERVVDVEGSEHLEEALAAGRGAMVLPLHFGPSYAIPPLLGHFASTRFAFNRMNFEPLRELAFPDLDVQAFDINDDATFLRGFRALRENQVFALFPELDPRGQEKHHARVPFLGTTVLVPSGPVLMSRRSGAPLIPVVLDSQGNGRFTLRILPPLAAPADLSDDEVVLRQLWKVIEAVALGGRLGDWEMWVEFDRMQPVEAPADEQT
jgi:lauroyl/myristoyl acyltransferase